MQAIGNSDFWAAVSFILGVVALPLSLVIVMLRGHVIKLRRPSYGSAPVRIPQAAIASDLIPLISGLKSHVQFKNSELWIFGSDGRYIVDASNRSWIKRRWSSISKKWPVEDSSSRFKWIRGPLSRVSKKWAEEKWHRKFRLWIKSGLKITYILLEADADVRQSMRDLKKDIGAGFDAFILKEGTIESSIQELRTYHPTLFIGADGQNAAWIEGWHPPDSIYAYDVTYIPPKAMQRTSEKELFEACKARLSLVKKNSKEP